MSKDGHISIAGLAYKRAQLIARLEASRLSDDDPSYDRILTQLEQLDWQVAHTPASDVSELARKIERLADLICPQGFGDAEANLETALMRSVFKDSKQLAEGPG